MARVRGTCVSARAPWIFYRLKIGSISAFLSAWMFIAKSHKRLKLLRNINSWKKTFKCAKEWSIFARRTSIDSKLTTLESSWSLLSRTKQALRPRKLLRTVKQWALSKSRNWKSNARIPRAVYVITTGWTAAVFRTCRSKRHNQCCKCTKSGGSWASRQLGRSWNSI